MELDTGGSGGSMWSTADRAQFRSWLQCQSRGRGQEAVDGEGTARDGTTTGMEHRNEASSSAAREETEVWTRLQNPPTGLFNSDHLEWWNNKAFISTHRLDDFVKGEGASPTNGTRFTKRKTENKNMEGGNRIVRYWCMYGPEDRRDDVVDTFPAERPPMKGPGSRLLAQHRRLGESALRGCLCHFQAICLKDRPGACLLKWMEREHVDKSGHACHGKLDPNAAKVHCDIAKNLSPECLEFVRNYLRAGVAPLQIIQEHYKEIRARCRGLPEDRQNMWARDLKLLPKDVFNVKRLLDEKNGLTNSKHDHISSHSWIATHAEDVLFYQIPNTEANVPFMLVWGRPWMIRTLATFGHGRPTCMDATFATNKYEYYLFTVLCYDAFQHGVPCAWGLLERNNAECITKMLEVVKKEVERVRRDMLGLLEPFTPTCFIVDDAKEEHLAIKRVFPDVPIILCLYHVRRAWWRQILQKVKSRLHRVELNAELAHIMYDWHKDEEAMQMSNVFIEKWRPHQPLFINYYEKEWHGRLQWWVKQNRNFNHCNQNTNGAIERWHRFLKGFLFSDKKDKKGRTITWLLWIMETKVELAYWVRDNLQHQGRIRNSIMAKAVLDGIYKAKSIPDEYVTFFVDNGLQCAYVQSETNESDVYELISFDKVHATCSCGDATQGNLCKHQIKCLLLRGISERQLVQVLGSNWGTPWGGMENLDDIDLGGPTIVVEDEDGLRLELLNHGHEGRVYQSPSHDPHVPSVIGLPPLGNQGMLTIRTKADFQRVLDKYVASIEHMPGLVNQAYDNMVNGFEAILELKAKTAIVGAHSMANIQVENLEAFAPRPGAGGFSVACQRSWVDRMHANGRGRRGIADSNEVGVPLKPQPFKKNKPTKPKKSMHQVLVDDMLEELQESVQNRRGKKKKGSRNHHPEHTPLAELCSNATHMPLTNSPLSMRSTASPRSDFSTLSPSWSSGNGWRYGTGLQTPTTSTFTPPPSYNELFPNHVSSQSFSMGPFPTVGSEEYLEDNIISIV